MRSETGGRRRAFRFVRVALLVVVAVVAVATTVFIVWAANPAAPTPRALGALQSAPDLQVDITDDDWLIFRPADAAGAGNAADSTDAVDAAHKGDTADERASGGERTPEGVSQEPATSTGIVFYPGGRVDHRAYAPLARLLAAHGTTVVVVPAPLNLMIFATGRAQTVMSAFDSVESWAIMGHSLGAAAATSFVNSNAHLVATGELKALILLAGYPAESWDLSDVALPVLSIAAQNDGVMDQDGFRRSRQLLPTATHFEIIAGANHAGFGDYGVQRGDGIAGIPPEEQQWRTAELVTAFLKQSLSP